MAKEGSNAFYRAYADRWYLDRANRDTYLARQAPGDIILSGHLYLATKLLKGLDTPSADGDAARKKYVDDLIALYLPLAGGALTGDVTMAAGKTIDGMDPSAHLTAIDAHVAELLATLLGGANFFHIPTNAGWTEVKTGSGTTTQGTFYNQVRTVATVSSSALLNCLLLGLGQDAAIYIRITWDKKLYLVFNYIRATPDTEAVGRLQLKETNAIGALAAKGIGIKVLDMALWGESYGTELGEVDLGVTLTDKYDKQIKIVHTPSVPKIEWFVDGVLKGTQSTASKIPSGVTATTSYLVHSINKSASTTTGDAEADLESPKIWQAR